MEQRKTKRYYPIFWNLEGKRCLIVGGGAVAQRKAKDLLTAGATVVLISRRLTEELVSMANSGEIAYGGKEYSCEHLRDVCMVIGATNDTELNKRIAVDAAERRIPFNIVDVPELCDFIVPATVHRGELTIAISTAGASPALAKKIRQELEDIYGEEYGQLLEVMRELRKKVIAAGKSEAENKKLFTALIASPLLEAIRNNEHDRAEEIVAKILEESGAR